jgi:hypothetical protein
MVSAREMELVYLCKLHKSEGSANVPHATDRVKESSKWEFLLKKQAGIPGWPKEMYSGITSQPEGMNTEDTNITTLRMWSDLLFTNLSIQ